MSAQERKVCSGGGGCYCWQIDHEVDRVAAIVSLATIQPERRKARLGMPHDAIDSVGHGELVMGNFHIAFHASSISQRLWEMECNKDPEQF